MAEQLNGRLLVAGKFQAIDGLIRNRLAQLTDSGELELGFDPDVDGTVYGMAIQADGKIVIVGSFGFVGGVARNRVARLEVDGSLDLSFDPDADGIVYAAAVQQDGKLLLGGSFQNVGGAARSRLARLNVDGSVDAGFDPGADGTVSCLVLQSDGRIVAGGLFNEVAGRTGGAIVRLESDGAADPGFSGGANNWVDSIALQADGKMIIGGEFTSVNGVSRNRVARLDEDGNLDGGFDPDASFPVQGLALQSDGKLLVGGNFRYLGGVKHSKLGRVTNNIAPSDVLSVTGTSQIDWMRGGSAPEVEQVSFEHWNGSGWVGLGIPSRIAGGWRLSGLSLPAAGRVRARGRTVGGWLNGSSGLVEQWTDYGGAAGPALTVTNYQYVGGSYVEVPVPHGGTFDFGTRGLLYSSEDDLQVAISGIPVPFPVLRAEIQGTGAEDFILSILGSGTTRTLRLNFRPTAVGLREAKLRIHVEGFEDTPCEVFLSGVGLGVDVYFEPNHNVLAAVPQANGGLLAGGVFTEMEGSVRNHLARRLSDSIRNPDPAFNPDIDGTVHTVAEQEDGKILVGGDFSTVGGVARGRVVRLHSDGSVDTGFDPGAGANGAVYGVLPQPDGKILVVGEFTTIDGAVRHRIARLNSDGSLDVGFAPDANASVFTVLLQSDGKVVVGGAFSAVNGGFRNGLARLNADGTLDAGFAPDPNNTVWSMAEDPRGGLIIGGSFTGVGGYPANHLARIEEDGSLDFDFHADVDDRVYSIAMRADGRILIGGTFTTVNGQARSRAAMLLADGTVATDFDPGPTSTVLCAAFDHRGEVLLGGPFYVEESFYDYFVRLRTGVPPVQRFESAASGEIQWIRGGGGSAVDHVEFDLWDGSDWVELGAAERVNGGWGMTGVTIPSGGWVRARGRTRGSYLSNSSGMLEYTGTYGTELPDIAVEGPGGTEYGDGGSTVELGTWDVGESADEVQLTIRNVGGGTLTGLDILIDGEHAGDFGHGSLSVTTLAPGESTVLTLSFGPQGAGTRIAQLQLISSDYDETPFDITLQGHGLGSGPFLDPMVSGGVVETTVVLEDGRILVGGSFHEIGGVARGRLALLNADGTLVEGFDPGIGGTVRSLLVQEDGKVLVGGTLHSVGGVDRGDLIRLLPDGSLDAGFDPDVSANGVDCLALQPDGKILLGGGIWNVGGVSRYDFARLNVDGSLDVGFDPESFGNVLTMGVQPDGKIVVGGYLNNLPGPGESGLVRYNPDGSRDLSFAPYFVRFDDANALVIQPDGKIVVGGDFTQVNNVARARIARLHPDGSLDLAFDPSLSDEVRTLVLQADGGLLVGGDFTEAGGLKRSRLVKIGSDGSIDSEWNPGASGDVHSLAIRADGSALVGGVFGTINGLPITRLAGVPAPDLPIDDLVKTGGHQLDWIRGGSAGAVYQVEFDLWNGSAWTGLGKPSWAGGSWRLTGLSLPSGGAVRARGRTQSGSGSGSSGVVSRILNFGTWDYSDILVEDSLGMELVSGGGFHDFGSQEWQLPSAPVSYTIRNVGTAELAGLELSSSRPDFVVGAPGTTTLAPGGSTTFTVTFLPSGGGLRSGAVLIASNDFQEPVFEIALRGIGIQQMAEDYEGSLSGAVLTVTQLGDGGELVAGEFAMGGDASRDRLEKFLPDGSLDPTFTAEVDGAVNAIYEQEDGRILIGGGFTVVNGFPRGGLARLWSNGSLDPSFTAGAEGAVHALAVQSDGRVLVGGDFLSINGSTRYRLARLHPDGTTDTSFVPRPSRWVDAIMVESDGSFLVGGEFYTIANQVRPNLARFNADGTLAPETFDVSGPVHCLALTQSGQTLIGGRFTTLLGTPRSNIARVNSDGSLDAGFSPATNGAVLSMTLQSDGSVVVGGLFTKVGGQTRNRVARILEDGSVDAGFDPNANGAVSGVALRVDGTVLVAGEFTEIGGVARGGVARIPNDVPATQSLVVTGTTQIDWQRGGSSPGLEQVFIEAWDGSAWVSHPVTRVPGAWRAGGLSLPTNGWVRVGGRSVGGRFGGSSKFVGESTTTGSQLPDITVLDEDAEELVSGAGELEFGSLQTGTTGIAQSLTIRNDGTADLSGLSLTVSGVDFQVGGLATSVLAPGASQVVPVSFSPRYGGERSAVLQIHSNDAIDTPFVVTLRGAGTGSSPSLGASPIYSISALSPPTPQSGELEGRAVAMDGDLIAVGAPYADVEVPNAGVVKVYDRTSATPEVPVAVVANPDPENGNSFGSFLAVSGSTLVVGQPYAASGDPNTGLVYVFDLDAADPQESLRVLPNPDPAEGDLFGFAVSIEGDLVVVGARNDMNGRGSVHVFDLSSATPEAPAFLLPSPDPSGGARYGDGVAISGNWIVVGASGTRLGGQSGAGLVYVYDLSAGVPASPLHVLSKPTPAQYDYFGSVVAIDQGLVVVGDPNGDTGGANAGSAWVFDLSSGSPMASVLTLDNPDPATSDNFGGAVSVSGDRIVVAARNDDTLEPDAGRVYVYNRSSGTPLVPEVLMENPTPVGARFFGTAVAIHGTIVVVGSPNDDTNAPDAGMAYVFDLAGGAPALSVAGLGTPGPDSDDQFGESVAQSGDLLVVGTRFDSTTGDRSGRVYVYDLSSATPGLPVLELDNPADPGTAPGDYFGAAVAISGRTMAVGAYGGKTAYVFDLDSSSPAVPVATLLHPNPGVSTSSFGSSVAISGGLVVVGDSGDGTVEDYGGGAYVFDLSSPTPTTPTLILHSVRPGRSGFGGLVLLEGYRLLVGASSAAPDGSTRIGEAYLYDLGSADPGTPTQVFQSPTPGGNQWFGHAAAIRGNLVVIGEPFARELNLSVGGVHIFDLGSPDPSLPVLSLSNPSPPTDGGFDRFGGSLSLSDSLVVVGARGYDSGVFPSLGRGRAYVYDLAGDSGSAPLRVLEKPVPEAQDEFGAAVSVVGTRVAVGVPRDDRSGVDQGAVYVFDVAGPLPEIVVESSDGAGLDAGSGVIDFGSVGAGEAHERTLTIRNVGDGMLTGLVTAISGMPEFSLVSAPSAPVPPGGQTSLTVRLAAGSAGGLSGSLLIHSNDGDELVFSVALLGQVVAPEIVVEQPVGVDLASGSGAVDFGFVAVGQGMSRTFAVRNAGLVNLSGISVSVSGPAAGDYALDDSLLPGMIAPGGAATFSVTFTAGAEGGRDASLRIASNDADESPFEISLTGEGILPIQVAQQAYLKATNAGGGDHFGFSVAISGDTVAVGARSEDGSSSNAGAVYVFVRSGTDWIQQAYLKASNPDANDFFGYAVALSGDTLVVGAYNEDGDATSTAEAPNNNATSAGAVYVFVRNGSSWSEEAYLKASNAESYDRFGISVSVSGDTLVAGAFNEGGDENSTGSAPNNNAGNSGAAYVFTRSGMDWSQEAYLKASNAGEGDRFGLSVSISGNTVVVGSNDGGDASSTVLNPNDNASTAGAAYVFGRSGAAWTQEAYLKAPNAGVGDRFGDSVSLDGDTLVVGAPFESGDESSTISSPNNNAIWAGAAYVFVRSGTNWIHEQYLKAGNAEARDGFGNSVAVSGNTAIVAAYWEDGDGNSTGSAPNNNASSAGAVYLFSRDGAGWNQISYLKASNAGANDQFGNAVAMSGNTVAMGAFQEDGDAGSTVGSPNDSATDAGAAYVFGLPRTSDIAVELPIGVGLVDGAGTIDFGFVATGVSMNRTFTVRNAGDVDLTGLAVNVRGAGSGDFTVDDSLLGTTLAPGAAGSFIVTFSPSAEGTSLAALQIGSNDEDENPFDLVLKGTGTTTEGVFHAIMNFAGLNDEDASLWATPYDDGVSNLLKYAFNMKLSGPDGRLMIPGGSSGLPGGELVEEGGQTYWRVEFVERIGSGLSYVPMKSTTLTPDAFEPLSATPRVEVIDDQWRRVIYDEPCEPTSTPRCFSFVEVALP